MKLKPYLSSMAAVVCALVLFFLGNLYLLWPSVVSSKQHHPGLFWTSIIIVVAIIAVLGGMRTKKVPTWLLGIAIVAIALGLIFLISFAFVTGFWVFLLFEIAVVGLLAIIG